MPKALFPAIATLFGSLSFPEERCGMNEGFLSRVRVADLPLSTCRAGQALNRSGSTVSGLC